MSPEAEREIAFIHERFNKHEAEEKEYFNKLTKSIEYNNKITENVIQQVSGIGSDLKLFKKDMEPVREGLHTVQSLTRFTKWLGLPALGALLSYWILK